MELALKAAHGWVLAAAIAAAACTAEAPAVDKPAEQPAAAPQAGADAPVVIANAMSWPECASLPAPAPTTRYVATDCRIDPTAHDGASGTQLLVRFSPTSEEVMAGGRVDVDVVGADGVVRDTLVEAYVFQYRYPVMNDTDGDGVPEVLIPREVADGQVTRSVWRIDPSDGRYRQTGMVKAPL
jgi:hypothetical protein